MVEFRNSRYMEEDRRAFQRPPPPERKSTVGMSDADRLVEEVRYGLEIGLYNSRMENQRFFGLMLDQHEEVEKAELLKALESHENRMKVWITEFVKTIVPNGDIRGHHDAHMSMMQDAQAWRERKKLIIDRLVVGLSGAAVPILGWVASHWIK